MAKVPETFEFGDRAWIIRENYVDNQVDTDEGTEIIFEDGSSVHTSESDLVAIVHPWDDEED